MSVLRHQSRPGAYFDSIVLMRLQRALAELPGVEDAGVVMATDANLAILGANGLLPEGGLAARPDDLLLALRAADDAAAAAALARVDELLAERRGGGEGGDYRPRSLAAALKQLPAARWVLVSVPGRFAGRVAREALEAGRNVFLYSDNVPLAEEVALKEEARRRGRLVLGPDCGTALVAGVGLGFANRVRRGPVGMVAASGTGLQAVASRLHELGSGVSHALGTGGRDLGEAVGAIAALQALDLLRRDPETRVVALISKPPAPAVAARVLGAARALGKPVVVAFLGAPAPARRLGSLHFAAGLDDAAELAARLAGEAGEAPAPPQPVRAAPTGATSEGPPYLRGLFAGGTLAYQAVAALGSVLAPLATNVPLRPEQQLADPTTSRGHTIVDLGADEFTVGRLHPMLDQEMRLRRLAREAADPEVGLILLDVVLGDGAHPDPAAELAPAVAAARATRPELEVVAVVVGTDEDPQDLEAQCRRLREAGARVFRSLDPALAHALGRLCPPPSRPEPMVSLAELEPPLAAINVGVETFHESLLAQGAPAVQVDWRPPAGGDERLMALLKRMR
jgi:FdrA protein